MDKPCRKCGTTFTPTPGAARQYLWVCKPCRNEHQRATRPYRPYRAKPPRLVAKLTDAQRRDRLRQGQRVSYAKRLADPCQAAIVWWAGARRKPKHWQT